MKRSILLPLAILIAVLLFGGHPAVQEFMRDLVRFSTRTLYHIAVHER